MSSCRDNTYTIRHSDNRKLSSAYLVPRNRLVSDEVDITLVGRYRLEYGEVFNRNVVKILERFACPSDDSNTSPDLTETNIDSLRNPIEGQLWFDNKNLVLFRYNGTEWVAFSSIADIAGVSGVIASGELLPRPVSIYTGYEFEYSECCWVVSPYNYDGIIDYMACYTTNVGPNNDVQVVSEYRVAGDATPTQGFANYQIIAIKGMVGGITGTQPNLSVVGP